MKKKVPIIKKTKRDSSVLRDASKHLFWNMRYLSERFEFVLRFTNRANEGEIGGMLSAIHDSFLIHARKMIEFLYKSSDINTLVYDDDLIAEDFFDTPDIWRKIRPLLSDSLIQARSNTGKLLAHFTYKLNEHSSGRITWETSDIYVDIFIAFQKFLSEVDQSFLDEQCDYLRESNPKIVICYPVFPPKGKAPYQIASTRDNASGLKILSED
ncbi:MAG: hypothetical protein AB9891_01640 [Anaerolineaceae bacterium]